MLNSVLNTPISLLEPHWFIMYQYSFLCQRFSVYIYKCPKFTWYQDKSTDRSVSRNPANTSDKELSNSSYWLKAVNYHCKVLHLKWIVCIPPFSGVGWGSLTSYKFSKKKRGGGGGGVCANCEGFMLRNREGTGYDGNRSKKFSKPFFAKIFPHKF